MSFARAGSTLKKFCLKGNSPPSSLFEDTLALRVLSLFYMAYAFDTCVPCTVSLGTGVYPLPTPDFEKS